MSLTNKEKGNECFKNQDYEQAIKYYELELKENPESYQTYSNKALCHIRLEQFAIALKDSEKCIEIKPDFYKAYYRRGIACYELGRLDDAIKDFKFLKQKSPSKDVDIKLKEWIKVKKERDFMDTLNYIHEDISKQEKEDNNNTSDSNNKENVSDENNIFNWKNIKLPENEDGYDKFIEDDEPFTYKHANELRNRYIKGRGKYILPSRYAVRILSEVYEVLTKKRDTLTRVNIKEDQTFTVVGDIHGQFFDFNEIFEKNGEPNDQHVYLFNGDYVDRGYFGVECVLTLFTYLLANPNNLYLSRGNHETPSMNRFYGFYNEVCKKYYQSLNNLFNEIFSWLPLAHVINDSLFIVHGGIPVRNITLDEISKFKRGLEPEDCSEAAALIWADPQTSNGSSPSMRGTGSSFGPDIIHNFLVRNKLKYIIRSHEVKMQGYEWCVGNELLTVFSAPRYCGQLNNKGAYVNVKFEKLEDGTYEPHISISTFDAVPQTNYDMTYGFYC